MNPIPMSRPLLASALAAALLGAGLPAHAAAAVDFQTWASSGTSDPALSKGQTISSELAMGKSSYADNPGLDYSAWAHAGNSPWYVFQLTTKGKVNISLSAVDASANFSPGLTLWASGDSMFDGGTEGVETGFNGWGDPHSFNAVGQIGDFGTAWMSGSNGNIKQTLAYAVAGPSHSDTSTTGWGEAILAGVNDIRTDSSFASGITGTASGNTISMTVNGMQAGWYAMFMGGARHNGTDATKMALSVTAVPEPGTWVLMAAGLGLLALRRRAA